MNEVKFSKVLDETTWDLTNFVCNFASKHDALLAEELFNNILQENEQLKSRMVVERYHKIALLKCEINELKAQLNDLMQKLSINEQDRRNLQSELDKIKSELLNKTQQLEWKDISTAPRDLEIITFGVFTCNGTHDTWKIKFANDVISSASPYPYTRTYHEYSYRIGTYIRTHWMQLPEVPKEEK